MKKFIKFALCLLLAFGFTGCNSKKKKAAEEARQKEIANTLTAAKKIVNDQYKDDVTTTADYEVFESITLSGKTVTITWSITDYDGQLVTVGESANSKKTIKVTYGPDTNPTETTYTLKGVFEYQNTKAEITFAKKIPAFVITSHADYQTAADALYNDKTGNEMTIRGLVSAILSKEKGCVENCLYIQGSEGGYYCYSLKTDPKDLQIGQEVWVSGTCSNHNGAFQIKGGDFGIINSTPAAVTPVDASTQFAKAHTDAGYKDLMGSYVKITGAVVESVDGQKLNFSVNDVPTYLRLSSSNCVLTAEQQTALTTGFEEKIGHLVDIKGCVTCYIDKGVSTYYLEPATTEVFTYGELAPLSDSKICAKEAEYLANRVADHFFVDKQNYELPEAGQAYADCAISWAFKDGTTHENASLDGSKLNTIVPTGANEEITLVATLTMNDATLTQEVKINLENPNNTITGDAFNALEDGKTGFVKGFVTSYSTYNNKNSFKINDGSITYAYVYQYDFGGTTVANGDYVVVRGEKLTYHNDSKNTDTYEMVKSELVLTYKAYTIEDFKLLNNDVEGMITGEVTTITENGEYKQITIADVSDSTKTITIKTLLGTNNVAFGKTNYQGQDVVVGSTIVVNGKKITDDTTVLMDDAVLVKYTAPYVYQHAGTEADPYSVADLKEYTKKLAKDSYTANEVVVTGYVKSVSGNWLTAKKFGVYIADSMDSNVTYQIYECYYSSGDGVYVGDKITVKGYIKNYNGTLEMTKKDDTTKPSLIAIISRGTSTVTSSAEHATVELSTTSGTNATSFTFTVTIDEGYELVSILVNSSKAADPSDGVYTAKILGNTVVTVATKLEGAVVMPKLTIDGSTNIVVGGVGDTNMKSASGYRQTQGAVDSVNYYSILNSKALFTTKPASITVKAKLSAGEVKNDEKAACYVVLLDSEEKEIASTKTEITHSFTKTATDFTCTITPDTADIYGIKIYSTKLDGWNMRLSGFEIVDPNA